MSDKQQYIITCRFPGWKQQDNKYPAFGVRYLITTPIFPYPEWPEDDKRWFTYDESEQIVECFKQQYEKTIKKPFNGEILFVEPSDLVQLSSGVQ